MDTNPHNLKILNIIINILIILFFMNPEKLKYLYIAINYMVFVQGNQDILNFYFFDLYLTILLLFWISRNVRNRVAQS